jgi:hypothetical protein
VTDLERLEEAFVKAGYPREYMPRPQFVKVAPYVAEACAAGVEDFIRAGWEKAGVDYPFVPDHPRYKALLQAYRELAAAP